jgi:LysR family transcriptional regulator, low CO2-responsive transcriptional regulator
MDRLQAGPLDGVQRRTSMDRAWLSAFDQIVRQGSFTRAAVAMNLGQPAVSSRLQALERALGGELFTRGRKVRLTALGEAFLPYARRALEVLGEGVEAARQAQVGQRGRVRLGSLASLAGGLVAPALAAFLRGRPAVECFAESGFHEQIVGLLLDGVVDLGLVVWPCTEEEAAELQPLLLLREPVHLVVGPRHPLAARRQVTQAEVARLGRPFFLLRWWKRHHPLLLQLAALSGAHVELPMEMARGLVMADEGAGFFVHTYVAEELERGALVKVEVKDLPRIVRGSALVRRKGGALSPAAAALVEALRLEAIRLGMLRPAERRKR